MSAHPRKRRRAVRPTDAAEIDRSWDSAEATQTFLGTVDLTDPRHSDDFVVIMDDSAPEEEESAELDEEFWKSQRPPHSG